MKLRPGTATVQQGGANLNRCRLPCLFNLAAVVPLVSWPRFGWAVPSGTVSRALHDQERWSGIIIKTLRMPPLGAIRSVSDALSA